MAYRQICNDCHRWPAQERLIIADTSIDSRYFSKNEYALCRHCCRQRLGALLDYFGINEKAFEWIRANVQLTPLPEGGDQQNE